MIEAIVVVREAGKTKPDYSLHFAFPVLPREGDYISISRPDTPEPWSEDAVVRKVWWRLSHPETSGVTSGDLKVGKVIEVFVECDIAEGPYASDAWRQVTNGARDRDIDVEYFDVERFRAPQSSVD